MVGNTAITEEVDATVPPSVGDRGVMVVGIDGSAGSAQALAWAMARTDRFGLVKGVISWHYPAWAVSDPALGALPPSSEDFEGEAKRVITEAMTSIPREARTAPVVVHRPAGTALVEEGATANLIVVGTRGRGAIADTILGSVSSHVVANANVPVAVVPATAPLTANTRVVVGVDGSPNSIAALVWAMATTDPGADLIVVHVWSFSTPMVPVADSPAIEFSEREGQRVLDDTLAAAMRVAGDQSHVIDECQLLYGEPASALEEFTDGEDLLVLGARRHRGLAGFVLGSVTSRLVHRPHVATVVVPGGDHPTP